MRIIVDYDSCPVVNIIEAVAEQFNIPVIYVVDTNHHITTQHSIIVVDQGSDAVDFKIISIIQKGDIVVTQDYGLASLVLLKSQAINPNGMIYTLDNMDMLLMARHLAKKERDLNNRFTKHKKRTNNDDVEFKENLLFILKKGLTNNS